MFTAQDVRAATGLTDVQLHRMTKTNILQPVRVPPTALAGRGRPAQLDYPPQEILIASIVAHLLKNDVPPRPFAMAINSAREQLYKPGSPGHAAYEGASSGQDWFMFLAKDGDVWRVGFAPDYSLLNELPDEALVMILPLHKMWKRAVEAIKGGEDR